MGDRAQLELRQGGRSIFLYTHWGGSELPEMLQQALRDAYEDNRTLHRDRSYCLGTVLRQFVGMAGPAGTTGLGVGFHVDENDGRAYPLVLDVEAETVGYGEAVASVPDFMAAENPSEVLRW